MFLSGNIGILPFEESDAAIAGDLRTALEANGTPIGPYDLLIAAQALRTGATLATANVAEFARVPSLDVAGLDARGVKGRRRCTAHEPGDQRRELRGSRPTGWLHTRTRI